MAVPRAEGDTRVAVFCWAAEILMCTASSQSVPARTVPLPLIFAARAIDNAICCRDWFPGIEPFPRVVPLLCQTTALSLFGVLAELWDLIVTYPGMLLATAGTAALGMVVVTSVRAASSVRGRETPGKRSRYAVNSCVAG